MSQPRRKKKADNKSGVVSSSQATVREQSSKWQGFVIIGLVLAVILIVIGVFYYQEYVAPFRRTVITVDTVNINMDYLLKRTEFASADPMAMLNSLTNEIIVKMEAPQYGIQVTPEDIDQELRRIASGGSGNITESEFKEWYRQQLNESRLSDSEYREVTRSGLLTTGLSNFLAERVPSIAEQVHLHAIVLQTYEDAQEVVDRLNNGEDFTDMARELSADPTAEENGGDLGWIPYGISDLVDYGTPDLEIGEISEPINAGENQGFYVLMISEKADAREVTEEQHEILKGRAFERWLQNEIKLHDIKFNFNSEIYAWLNWQLSKQ